MRKNILAAMLAATLMLPSFSVITVSAEEKKEDFIIRTVDDYLILSKNCSLDDWSRDRTIILENDLDFTDYKYEFTSIYIFDGTFEGGGHTLSNIYIHSPSDVTGIFNYIDREGIVKDLNVEVSVGYNNITSNEMPNVIAGIAAVNSGVIDGCSANVKIEAKSVLGAIAGQNGKSGVIRNCKSSGSVDASCMVGGIAGINYGLIQSSTNNAKVNTGESWLDSKEMILSLDLQELINNGEDMISAKADIGGIAGYSEGIITGCENRNVVGYKDNGFDVGGIVGRHLGLVDSCTNYSAVYGKQEVGGIVGKQQPVLEAKKAEAVKDYVSALHDAVEKLVDDCKESTLQITDKNDDLLSHTSKAKELVYDIIGEGKRVIKEDVEQINDLSGRVHTVVEAVPGITESINSEIDRVSAVNNTFKAIEGSIKKAALSASEQAVYDQAISTIRTELLNISGCGEKLNNNYNAIKKFLESIEENISADSFEETLGKLTSVMDIADSARVSCLKVGTGIATISQLLKAKATTAATELDSEFSTLNQQISDLCTGFKDINTKVNSVFSYLSSLDAITFILPGEEYDNNSELLKTEIDSIIDILNSINSLAGEKSELISADIKNINDIISKITNIVIDKYEEITGIITEKKAVEDHSDDSDASEKASKTIRCTNEGVINGRKDVGGIAGCVNVETVSETSISKNLKLGSKYHAYALIDNCYNSGNIIAKKAVAGGIVGCLVKGKVSNCFARGYMSSEDTAGGIAGSSEGYIRGCGAMMCIECNKILGGIAGAANKVSDCYCLDSVVYNWDYFGAIIGLDTVDTKTDISQYINSSKDRICNNYYVGDSKNGIGDISIKGSAEEISYEELMSIPGIFEDFGKLKLIFLDVDYNIIESFDISYGEELDYESPKIELENRKKYIFVGGDYEAGAIANGDIICRGYIYNSTSTLTQFDENGEDYSVLVGGDFSIVATLYYSIDEDRLPATGKNETAKTYVITIFDDKLDEEADFPVRIRIDSDVDAKAYRYVDGDWILIESEISGSYLSTTMHTNSDIISVVTKPKENNLKLYIIIAISAGGVLLLIIIFCLVKRVIKHNKK